MDKILKWNMTTADLRYPDEVDKLCKKGWEPFAVRGDSSTLLLKRPCGELSITKHPEITHDMPVTDNGMEM